MQDYLTPLHVAAHCGNVKTAKLLLDRKCEVNARALVSSTLFHLSELPLSIIFHIVKNIRRQMTVFASHGVVCILHLRCNTNCGATVDYAALRWIIMICILLGLNHKTMA